MGKVAALLDGVAGVFHRSGGHFRSKLPANVREFRRRLVGWKADAPSVAPGTARGPRPTRTGGPIADNDFFNVVVQAHATGRRASEQMREEIRENRPQE